MGGGTGTGASPVVAEAAKSQGILTVGVVTKPFTFEGAERARIADMGLERLRHAVDALIVIPNDRLLTAIEKEATFLSAFAMCDEVLRQAVEGISDLIRLPGVINVDFADVRAILQNAGSALMGIGAAHGEKRAEQAAHRAINSPLLDMSIDGAKGVLFSIAGGVDMTMWEIQDAARIITDSIDKEARVIFGAIIDERLKKNELKITVIASGFPEKVFSAKIFNELKDAISLPLERQQKINTVSENLVVDMTPKNSNSQEEKDDWNTIPAFLRRSRK